MTSISSPVEHPARSFPAAAKLLSERDPVLRRLVKVAGAPRLPPQRGNYFEALVHSIVSQQLAGAAAAVIYGRVVAAVQGEVDPERVLALAPGTLRSAGLSGSKVSYIQDLAMKVLDGTVVLEPKGLRSKTDEEIVEALSVVRGIGRGTAEMFLLFELRRLDVWPTADLGVRKGFGRAWGLPVPAPKELESLGDRYRPYRSVVAWYCWRAVEL